MCDKMANRIYSGRDVKTSRQTRDHVAKQQFRWQGWKAKSVNRVTTSPEYNGITALGLTKLTGRSRGVG
jgi:hypothetical protein